MIFFVVAVMINSLNVMVTKVYRIICDGLEALINLCFVRSYLIFTIPTPFIYKMCNDQQMLQLSLWSNLHNRIVKFDLKIENEGKNFLCQLKFFLK